MRLLLDVGNTSIQWMLATDNFGPVQPIQKLQHDCSWAGSLKEIVSELRTQGITTVFIASVLDSNENEKIRSHVEVLLAVPVVFYETEAERLGFKNSYSAFTKLGVDRWLAILEAWHRQGACVVIDCGSAITIDVANDKGQHLGGYIVPGYSMLVKALYSGTAQVKVTPKWPTDLKLAANTAQAVNRGCAQMCASFINQVLEKVASTYGPFVVYLTGGDAVNLVNLIQQVVLLDDTLVLHGLNRVAIDILRGR